MVQVFLITINREVPAVLNTQSLYQLSRILSNDNCEQNIYSLPDEIALKYSHRYCHEFSLPLTICINIPGTFRRGQQIPQYTDISTTIHRDSRSLSDLFNFLSSSRIDAVLFLSEEQQRSINSRNISSRKFNEFYITKILCKDRDLAPVDLNNQENLVFNCKKLRNKADQNSLSSVRKLRADTDKIMQACIQIKENQTYYRGIRHETIRTAISEFIESISQTLDHIKSTIKALEIKANTYLRPYRVVSSKLVIKKFIYKSKNKWQITIINPKSSSFPNVCVFLRETGMLVTSLKLIEPRSEVSRTIELNYDKDLFMNHLLLQSQGEIVSDSFPIHSIGLKKLKISDNTFKMHLRNYSMEFYPQIKIVSPGSPKPLGIIENVRPNESFSCNFCWNSGQFTVFLMTNGHILSKEINIDPREYQQNYPSHELPYKIPQGPVINHEYYAHHINQSQPSEKRSSEHFSSKDSDLSSCKHGTIPLSETNITHRPQFSGNIDSSSPMSNQTHPSIPEITPGKLSSNLRPFTGPVYDHKSNIAQMKKPWDLPNINPIQPNPSDPSNQNPFQPDLEPLPNLINPQEKPSDLPSLINPQGIPTDLSKLNNPQGIPTDLPSLVNHQEKPSDLPSLINPREKLSDLPNLVHPQGIPTDLSKLNNPQGMPTDLPKLNNPQGIPTDLPKLNNPHGIPTDLPKLNNPHGIPTDLPKLNNPQGMPTDLPKLNNPHGMPTDLPKLNNPHGIPTDLPNLFNPQGTTSDLSEHRIQTECNQVSNPSSAPAESSDPTDSVYSSRQRNRGTEMNVENLDLFELQNSERDLKTRSDHHIFVPTKKLNPRSGKDSSN